MCFYEHVNPCTLPPEKSSTTAYVYVHQLALHQKLEDFVHEPAQPSCITLESTVDSSSECVLAQYPFKRNFSAQVFHTPGTTADATQHDLFFLSFHARSFKRMILLDPWLLMVLLPLKAIRHN
jgi:hypothetical protein